MPASELEPSTSRRDEDPDVIRDRPILFGAPMVRSLLNGTKTQTRRALNGFFPRNRPEYDSETGRLEWFNGDEAVIGIPCPYGQPGDRLWVRETWAETGCWDSPARAFCRSPSSAWEWWAWEASSPWLPVIRSCKVSSTKTSGDGS